MINTGFQDFLKEKINGQKVLLLGFGREGQSSWNMLRDIVDYDQVGIADKNAKLDLEAFKPQVQIMKGEAYLADLSSYDVILRSPGIPSSLLSHLGTTVQITSQSALFLEFFHDQVIGVTGTKGKSTTSTLIHAMLEASGCRTFLAGNIGLPPFEVAGLMEPGTIAVLELSAHQLEDIRCGPHIACLLNLYEEHLDHFIHPIAYYTAKWRLFSSQKEQDMGIYPYDIPASRNMIQLHPPISQMLAFSHSSTPGIPLWLEGETLCFQHQDRIIRIDASERPGLPGQHNLMNSLVAATATLLAGGNEQGILHALAQYKGLPHRLEYVGRINGRDYYNDAIATAPEATMAAIETLERVDTLILGGMDRGIAYDELVNYLIHHNIPAICASGPAGRRICELLKDRNFKGEIFFSTSFEEAVKHAISCTTTEGSVLLSPSAPSYDEFNDFTEKGKAYVQHLGA